MSSLVLSRSEPLSVVTLSRPGVIPAWREWLDWPVAGHAHVDVVDDDVARRNAVAVRIDAAVTAAAGPVLLVAQGPACHAAAWWARLSPSDYVARVAGALLFRPGGEGAGLADRYAAPAVRLPFQTLVVDDDPEGGDSRRLAADWGGRTVAPARLGRSRPAGAFDADAAVADPGQLWRQAGRAFARYTAGVVRRDLRLARDRRR